MQLTPRDKKMLMVLGGVAGVAVLFLLYQFVLKGGGGETAAPGPTIGPTVVPTVTPSLTPRLTPPPALVVGARDPFSVPPALCTVGGGVSPSPSVSASPGAGTGGGGLLPGCPTPTPSATVSPGTSVTPSPSVSPSHTQNPNRNPNGGRHQPQGS